MSYRLRKLVGLAFSLALIGGAILVWTHRQDLYDAVRLHNYQPPAATVQLADQTTMTSYARHLFYVNHPQIQEKADFSSSCPNNGGEQTIVLGCYRAHETGIYLLSVADPQLNGVEQVTAAHETLHAIYERLSTKERDYVDGLLQDYYQNDLHDQRLLGTIAAYKKTEPSDVVNEMHSVFGTEIANLPPALENYYKQYFTNRSQIAAFAAQYQAIFTSRQNLISQYDAQLASLKQQISANEADLASKETALKAQRAQLDNYLSSGQTQVYNATVASYNAGVQAYNSEINATQNFINRYNLIVKQRNAIAVQVEQLDQELSGQNLSTKPTTQ